jgi:hypothetical protein
VLKEKVRKYRGQAQELERQLGQRDRRVAVLEAEVERLDATVQARGPWPGWQHRAPWQQWLPAAAPRAC